MNCFLPAGLIPSDPLSSTSSLWLITPGAGPPTASTPGCAWGREQPTGGQRLAVRAQAAVGGGPGAISGQAGMSGSSRKRPCEARAGAAGRRAASGGSAGKRPQAGEGAGRRAGGWRKRGRDRAGPRKGGGTNRGPAGWASDWTGEASLMAQVVGWPGGNQPNNSIVRLQPRHGHTKPAGG